jgi:hypothetical protein
MDAQVRSEIVGLAHAYCFEKTERDDKIISFLYENGYALASQLLECGFSSKPALIQRLSLLKKSGLIRSKRVGEFDLLQPWLRQVAYRGTPKSATDLIRTKIYYLNPLVVESHYKRKFLFNESMIRHQLGLGLIRNLLVKVLNPKLILSENKWISQLSGKKKESFNLIPDLVISSGEIRLAVEYERSLKGKSTYLSKWYDYERSEFSHVLYFAETPALFEKLKAYSGLTHRMGFVEIQEPQLVYLPRSGFISLSDFFEARFV